MTTPMNSRAPAHPGSGDMEWLSSLPLPVKAMWENVCRAMEAGSFTLVAPGARALIERVVRDLIGDVEAFPQRLESLERQGYIGRRQKEQLAVVVETGNATLHRELELSREQASVLLGIIETLLRIAYLSEERVNSLKALIPPRRRNGGR